MFLSYLLSSNAIVHQREEHLKWRKKKKKKKRTIHPQHRFIYAASVSFRNEKKIHFLDKQYLKKFISIKPDI